DRGDVDALVRALDGGAGVDPPADVDAQSALQRAADKEQLDIVRVLVERGANVNRTTKYANPPLLSATSKGNREMAAFLLEHGADANATSDSGYGAIHAAASEHPALLPLFEQHGARFSGDAARANAPIIEAARRGQ